MMMKDMEPETYLVPVLMDPEGLKTYESYVSGSAHTDYKFIKVLDFTILKETIDQKKDKTFS
jgi:hypothetical protein